MKDYPFDKLWNYNDPAAIEKAFREALPEAEGSGDPEHLLQLKTQIARTYGLRRMFAEAHALLDEVEQALSEETPVARVRYLLERGRAFNSGGFPARALPLFLEAWERGKAVGDDGYAVDAAHMVAIAETGEAELEWNLKAIEYARASEQPRGRNWPASLYNNTAWSLHDRGDYEKALQLFEDAVEFRKEQGNPETIRIAKWCVGRCLRSMGRNEEALAIMQTLAKEAEETGENDGYTQEELGELMLLKGEEAQAQAHFASAYAQLSEDPWMMEHEAERMARMKELGGW